MDDQRLRAALALASTGSLRKAAERMFCSQSTLSDAIKGLERDLSCTLFTRGSRGMIPVEGSEAVFAQMRAVITECDVLAQAASDLSAGIGGRVRVCCVLSATETVVPRIYQAWDREVPGLGLELDIAPPQQQLSDLESGECDIGLLRAPVAREGYHERIILREPLGIATPKSWHRNASITGLDDVRHRPMVRLASQHGPGLYPEICRMLANLGIEPQIQQESDDMSTLIAMVAGGLGWSIIPMSLRARHPRDVVVVRDDRLPTTDLAAVTYGDTVSAFQQRFLDLIQDLGRECEHDFAMNG